MCEGALVLLKLVREKDNSAQESLTLYFASVDLFISSEPPLQKQTHQYTHASYDTPPPTMLHLCYTTQNVNIKIFNRCVRVAHGLT